MGGSDHDIRHPNDLIESLPGADPQGILPPVETGKAVLAHW